MSVCTVIKPKGYNLYLPTVFIDYDVLKFIRESKYLGFTFSDSKSDDCDMLRQMRLLYDKSSKLLQIFSHWLTDDTITLFQSYCTVLYCPYCGTEKLCGLPKWSSASTMYANQQYL